MKLIRHIGSLAFVLGLFTAVFAGIPWYVIIADDPVVPLWLRTAVFCLLGGILVVLVALVLEQRVHKASVEEPLPTESVRTVLLLNSDVLPRREITEILGLVQGHTVFAIWFGKDLSALVRLILGGELTDRVFVQLPSLLALSDTKSVSCRWENQKSLPCLSNQGMKRK